MTRCLRWSSITFDIEGVGKVTLALLSSPSFPFGGKRGNREKMMCTKIPKHRRLANSLTRGLVQLLHLTRGLRIISSSLVYRDATREPRLPRCHRRIALQICCRSFFNQSRHRIYVGGKFSISYWSLKMICKKLKCRAIWSGESFVSG